MGKLTFVVLVLTAVSALAFVKRQAPGQIVLPAGAELVVGQIQSSVNCDGQKGYGYYADPASACKIFHICVPPANGKAKWLQYSFFCGNQTVFDQEKLVCSDPKSASPCDQASKFYSVNDNFGKTDRPSG